MLVDVFQRVPDDGHDPHPPSLARSNSKWCGAARRGALKITGRRVAAAVGAFLQQAVGCRASPAVIRRSEGCRLDGAWARR